MIGDRGANLAGTLFETLGRAFGRAQERRPLPVDLLESDDEFLAVFDAPGAISSDVQARYEDGAIHVRIDRFRDFYEGYEMQFPGRGLALDGHVELPDDAEVDPQWATATLTGNGTLHVRVPKVDEEDDEKAEEADDEDGVEEADEDEAGEAAEDEEEAEEADENDEATEEKADEDEEEAEDDEGAAEAEDDEGAAEADEDEDEENEETADDEEADEE